MVALIALLILVDEDGRLMEMRGIFDLIGTSCFCNKQNLFRYAFHRETSDPNIFECFKYLLYEQRREKFFCSFLLNANLIFPAFLNFSNLFSFSFFFLYFLNACFLFSISFFDTSLFSVSLVPFFFLALNVDTCLFSVSLDINALIFSALFSFLFLNKTFFFFKGSHKSKGSCAQGPP